ncbi:hypothetical protein BOTBODRAFT_635356 [Botryobasidium botryosum FD-172 SS1]|uniref:RNA exonuclease 4 n=1 Tax=Botryobasidium botryosum (strain FD-172 SS1) TaxID=930990 RepID=A0A067M8A7_BOTB1|nr:hypothetical protein BOTBODRAFT_635356 [Botryobasidium botryosum FD-172 SS1]
MDCEMVGVGPQRGRSALARVSIVNFHGAVIFDTYVQQTEPVTDYRTFVSGIREADLLGDRALPFADVQFHVQSLLSGRVLVGHALHNDFQALKYWHPVSLTRDTQHCPVIQKTPGQRTLGLKALVEQKLGITIQQGEHSSVIDARAAMAIFRIYRMEWEALLLGDRQFHKVKKGNSASKIKAKKPGRGNDASPEQNGAPSTERIIVAAPERMSRRLSFKSTDRIQPSAGGWWN